MTVPVKRVVGIAARLLATAETATAQRTLPEIGRDKQEPINLGGSGCGPYPTLTAIASRADLAVYGTVMERSSHLSRDEREIETDYRIEPRQVLFQRIVLTSDKLGWVPPMIFKTRGG